MRNWLLATGICACLAAYPQSDPEFPKGSVLYLGAKQGKSTAFDLSPDLWVGSIYFSPQFTVAPMHLRLGAVAELVYTDKHTSAILGPRVAWKIKTIKMENLGSLLNLQLQAEYLWGTRDQRLIGGNFAIEAFQLLVLDLSAHRDYAQDQWWLRAGLGIRLFKKKKSPTGDDPMDDN